MSMRITDNSTKGKTNSRHFWMLFITVILLIAAFASSIVASTSFFKRTTRSYREEIIIKTSKLVAEQIDGDKVNLWLNSGADDEYKRTAVLIQSICNNTPYIQYIYVYQIKPDGCHVVFDVETKADELKKYDEVPQISTDYIGEVVDFDESFSDKIPTLLAGGNIDIIETNDKFGWLLTKYEPVFDSSGKCVAYVGVDISMVGVKDYYRSFTIWIVAISAVFLVVLIVAGYLFFAHERKVAENAEFVHERVPSACGMEGQGERYNRNLSFQPAFRRAEQSVERLCGPGSAVRGDERAERHGLCLDGRKRQQGVNALRENR